MNCSTMYKRFFCCIIMLLLSVFLHTKTCLASQEEEPGGDILILTSDGADKDVLEEVNDMVELLTYQSFQVSYGSASWGKAYLGNFSYIICYDLINYPSDLSEDIKAFEDLRVENSQEKIPHILFMGNEYLKTYLDDTGRSDEYLVVDSPVGELSYTFDGLSYQTGLVKDNYFLFLKQYEYKNGSLSVKGTTGYYCAQSDSITHIPVADINDGLSRAAFIKEVAQWKWPYNGSPNVFPQYILIDKVYPYEDPEKLLAVVKILADKKTPFVISVMPIYVNGDYPAMTHFCEVLRYAQAEGGAVIINAPINQMSPFEKDVVLEYLGQALEIYNKQGVYPLALEVPHNWLFNEDTIEILSHFKTIFTTEESDSYIEPSDMRNNLIYKDGHQWVGPAVALDDLKTSYLSAYSSSVSISMEDDMDKILVKVKACQNSSVPLKSLWDMEHSYWTEKNLMTYDSQDLMLNGKKMDLSFVPTTYPENYNYHRNMLQRFSKDLTSQSKKLIILVGITSALFMIFIFWARYMNRKNYFFRGGKDR